MPTQEELDAAKKVDDEKKVKEEEARKLKEEEEDKKLESMVKDKDAAKALIEAKRKANAEAKEYRLKLEEITKKQGEADDEKLKKDNKYKELSEKQDAEMKEDKVKFTKRAKIEALKTEAIKQNIKDADDVRLIDLGGVKIDDSYNVENAQEVVEEFKGNKAHLFKGDDDDDDETKLAESNRTPNLRDKVAGGVAKEGESPHSRATSFFSNLKKKKR